MTRVLGIVLVVLGVTSSAVFGQGESSNPWPVDRAVRGEDHVGPNPLTALHPTRNPVGTSLQEAILARSQDLTIVKPPRPKRSGWKTTGILLFATGWVGTPLSDRAIEPKRNYGSLWVPVIGPTLAWNSAMKDVNASERSKVKAAFIISTAIQATGLMMMIAAKDKPVDGRTAQTAIGIAPTRRGLSISLQHSFR